MAKKIKLVNNEKNRGDIGELRGLLASARQMGLKKVILSIPVRLFAIDTAYQTDARTDRDLGYLVNNWDERKLLTLIVVPHDEEGLFYVVDGYGRWRASQIVDAKKYETLECLVLLDAPTSEKERQIFEAEIYAFQNKDVAKMTPLQRHGSLRILGDAAVLAMDEFKEKYGFEYVAIQGQRAENVLGSYGECLRICKAKGKDCMDYIFTILQNAGFDRKSNGYAIYIIKALCDIYVLYANNREETKEFLSTYLREISPKSFRANSVSAYKMLNERAACSLYAEDLVVNELGLEQSREVLGTRLVAINRVA